MQSVLITGGSGFFARGFVRAALNQGVERICIYSRGEFAQHQMRMEFASDLSRLRFFIGDVRDRDRLEEAMNGVDTVVHAAALKRIEVGHYNPEEVYKTNIMGTMNVISAARRSGVQRVVFLSSDKAANPVSAYGISKAAAEAAILSANHTRGADGPIFAAVRYGNVWKSTGSVVPVWQEMIKAGVRVVPVTNPECTRFFMRREEAVSLVMRAINEMSGSDKDLFIPELPAYRLGDLAEAMEVGIIVTGLGEFEKLAETMDGKTDSSMARRMSVEELREALSYV